MICISIQNKTYGEILEILADPKVEMAEIRLDRCPLSDEEIADLFGNSHPRRGNNPQTVHNGIDHKKGNVHQAVL